MAALKLPRRPVVRPRVEAVEREEYAAAPTPSVGVRRTLASVVKPKPVSAPVPIASQDDYRVAAMSDEEFEAYADEESWPPYIRKEWRGAAQRAVRKAEAAAATS